MLGRASPFLPPGTIIRPWSLLAKGRVCEDKYTSAPPNPANLPGISQIFSWLCQEDCSSLVLSHVSKSRRDISCPCLVVFLNTADMPEHEKVLGPGEGPGGGRAEPGARVSTYAHLKASQNCLVTFPCLESTVWAVWHSHLPGS